MKALKLLVVALLVVIAGLLFTIKRLTNQTMSSSNQTALAPASTSSAPPVARELPPAPVAETPQVSPAPQKPTPVLTRRPLTKPRQTNSPATTPAAEPPVATASAAPAPAPPAPAPVVEAPRVVEAPKAPPAQPAPRTVTIPAGTALIVRTQNTLSTERNFKGDTFTVTLDEPLTADGYVIAEKGATVEGHVLRSEKAGRVEGLSELEIELVRLHTSDGQRIPIATELHDVRGAKSRGSDAKKVGVATGLGAIIGAIAGGGKGAAIGAGVGAGAGGGAVLATRGKPAVIPSESRLTFHLRTPLEVTERPSR